MSDLYDLAIIGGGINGCGIARDAAGRGLKVYLCEMGDLAGGTSSWSTKLIHGGLRYLEFYEFRLVRESLEEREVLWALAPHTIQPIRFVLPHHAGLRPKWMLRTGLFLYDHLGGRRRLPPTRTLDLARDAAGAPLRPGMFRTGYEYSDCTVDDARLVVLNAIDARERGARIETRTKAIAARREQGVWSLDVDDVASGERGGVRARVLVNAAGPWVAGVLGGALGLTSKAHVRLVQGSHIVVRRMFEHDRAYIFQNTDGRIVFAIPFQRDFTLIGTTDRDYAGDPGAVRASTEEIAYLCTAVSGYFARAVTPADVVWSFSGVRPLYDDGASEARAATRDYVFELDAPEASAPVLSIFGGKITTYRRLAEHALDRLAAYLPQSAGEPPGWTGKAALPGGDFAVGTVDGLVRSLRAEKPFLDAATAERMAHAYGTRARAVLEGVRDASGLGRQLGSGLTEAEVRYLMAYEWARTAEDIVWRRTKLGLRMSAGEITWLESFMRSMSVRVQ